MDKISEISLLRSQVNSRIREFFFNKDYLEVDTPLLSADLIPESSIEIFKTQRHINGNDFQDLFLIPSPEVWMKKLLARDSGSIFQICKSFRNSEQSGCHHRNEFTMLEWYSENLDYKDNIELTRGLFIALASLSCEENRHFFTDDFLILTMDEAFLEHAGFSLLERTTSPLLKGELDRLGLPYSQDDSRETLFNRIFLTLVEPNLPVDSTVILTDYPSFIPTLAKTDIGSSVSERWEMYVKGIELANCYTEESDAVRVADYFKKESEEKKTARIPHKIDLNYSNIFNSDYPEVSGVAMGVDRLIMALGGYDRIDDVLLFP